MSVFRDDAGRRYRWEEGRQVYLDPPTPAEEMLAEEGPSSNGRPSSPDLLARLRNGSWLDEQRFPPLRYHLPRVVPEGSTLLVGPPKIGKSWLVLALGLAAACGGRVLGVQVDARPVLYLALEDGDRRLQDRCRSLLQGDPIPGAFEYLTVVESGRVFATVSEWLAQRVGEPLVILDTLGRVMPPALMGESSYQRDYRVGAALKRLADEHPGVALLVNHHDRKAASDDFVERVSGTNGLAGAADTIILLTRSRHERNGLLQVTGRDIAEDEYAMTFDGESGLWHLDGGDFETASTRATQHRATAGVGDRMAEVIAFVGDCPRGAGVALVASALGIAENTARVYLSRAVEAGRLSRPERGLYMPVASVALLRSEENRRSEGYPSTDETQHRVAFVGGGPPGL